MYNLTPIRSLPVLTPLSNDQHGENFSGLREDGSFDFTQFFTSFDLNSEVGKYLDEWDPALFLALLRVAASPAPKPPRSTSSLLNPNPDGCSESAMAEYRMKLEARKQATSQLDKEINNLDAIITQMNDANVPGVDQLKREFTAAKGFIFEAVANSSSRILDIHLEFEDSLSTPGTPRTPASPVLGTIPLPVVTPVSTPRALTPITSGRRWPSMLTGPDGLAYRVVATPRDVSFDSSNYFQSHPIPSSPTASTSSLSVDDSWRERIIVQLLPQPLSRRSSSNWLRTISELRTHGTA